MKKPYMFVSCLIPGPTNPTKRNRCILALIDDLQQLWSEGVFTYDISTKENFVMRSYLTWIINNFLAYAMLSRWGTKGKLVCPHCMEDIKSFTLKHGVRVVGLNIIDNFCQPIIIPGGAKGKSLKTDLKLMTHLIS